MSTSSYVSGSRQGKLWFIAFVLLWIIVIALLWHERSPFATRLPDSASPADIDAFLLHQAFQVTAFYLVLSVAVIAAARASIRSGQWPPHGLPVPFRTKIYVISNPWKAYAFAAIFLLAYLTHIVVAFYKWHVVTDILDVIADPVDVAQPVAPPDA